MRVAVLGLGHMGRAVSLRLLGQGYQVTAWNRTPGRAADVFQQGGREAGSVAEAVARADVAITLLSNDAAVKRVCLGEGGAIASLPEGAVLVDMSTVHPDTSRELAAAVPGGMFADAPILGGPEALVTGRAKLLVGGREDVVKDLDPLWNDLADSYYYTGVNGTPTTLKLLSNLILVGSTELLAEAVAAGQANGIGDDVLRLVLGESPAVAPGVRVRLDDILDGDHRGWWTLELADKDMSLAVRLATGQGTRAPVAQATDDEIRRAIAEGYGEKDLGAIVEVLRQRVSTRA